MAINITGGATIAGGVSIRPLPTIILNASSITNYDGGSGWDSVSTFDATTDSNIDFYPEIGDPLITQLLNVYGPVGGGGDPFRIGFWETYWNTGSSPNHTYLFVVLYAQEGSPAGYGIYMQPQDVGGSELFGTYVLPATLRFVHMV